MNDRPPTCWRKNSSVGCSSQVLPVERSTRRTRFQNPLAMLAPLHWCDQRQFRVVVERRLKRCIGAVQPDDQPVLDLDVELAQQIPDGGAVRQVKPEDTAALREQLALQLGNR